jgi:hypothetical protein
MDIIPILCRWENSLTSDVGNGMYLYEFLSIFIMNVVSIYPPLCMKKNSQTVENGFQPLHHSYPAIMREGLS